MAATTPTASGRSPEGPDVPPLYDEIGNPVAVALWLPVAGILASSFLGFSILQVAHQTHYFHYLIIFIRHEGIGFSVLGKES